MFDYTLHRLFTSPPRETVHDLSYKLYLKGEGEAPKGYTVQHGPRGGIFVEIDPKKIDTFSRGETRSLFGKTVKQHFEDTDEDTKKVEGATIHRNGLIRFDDGSLMMEEESELHKGEQPKPEPTIIDALHEKLRKETNFFRCWRNCTPL